MQYAVWGMLLALVVLHQIGIAADDTRMLFGFLPIGLAFHAAISIAAAATWLFATIYAWPVDVEVAEQPIADDSPAEGDAR